MTYQHSMAADPPIQVGEEIIAFLTDSDGSGTCALPFGAFGLFRVQGDKVADGNKEVARRRRLRFLQASVICTKPFVTWWLRANGRRRARPSLV